MNIKRARALSLVSFGILNLILLCGASAKADVISNPIIPPTQIPPPTTPTCVSTPGGVVGIWRGDGNTAEGIAGNDGVAVNSGYTNGVVLQAFSFDPELVGGYTGVQVADLPQYALTNSLTIEGWIRPRGDGYIIFWRGDNRPGLDPYSLSMQGNNTLSFNICDADGNGATVQTTLNYGDWTYVAATLDGSTGTMSIYTNGVLASQTTTAIRPFGQLEPGDSPGVGIGNLNDGQNNFPFLGDIDEITLYSRALTVDEIDSIYSSVRGKCDALYTPVIEVQPVGQTVLAGSTVTLSVTAGSTTPMQYQWQHIVNSITENIPGATNSTLTLSNISPDQAGNYIVQVSNDVGPTLSAPAMIQVTVLNILDYTYSGSDTIISSGTELTYNFSGQMFFVPSTTNGTFVGWANIRGHKLYWVSPFADYHVVTVSGSAGRRYTVFGKAGEFVDSSDFTHIWSYVHTGQNELLNIGTGQQFSFPRTMTGDSTHLYPATLAGNMILDQTHSTYTFSPTDTRAANNQNKTMQALVNALTARLQSAGYALQAPTAGLLPQPLGGVFPSTPAR